MTFPYAVFGDDSDSEAEEEEEEAEEEEEKEISSSPLPRLPPSSRPSSGAARSGFDEVYKPFELTEFDSLFTRNMIRTAE